jgi:hypothetical protein
MFNNFEGYLLVTLPQFDRYELSNGYYYLYSSTGETAPLRLKRLDNDQ